jgi:hypothetical protein
VVNNPLSGAFVPQQASFFIRRKLSAAYKLVNNPESEGGDLFVSLLSHQKPPFCVIFSLLHGMQGGVKSSLG